MAIGVLVTLSLLSGILPHRFRGPGVAAFYACVFPLGVGVLFGIVQGSSSPANSIEQGIECLMALSAICLSVTLPVSLLVMQKRLLRSLTHGRGPWLILGVVASIFLLHDLLGIHESFPLSRQGFAVLEVSAGFQFTRYELVVGIVLALFTLLGIALRLGPTVPCVFLGIVTLKLFLILFIPPSRVSYDIQSGYRMAIQKDAMILFMGAICGTGLGLALDGWRASARQPDGEQNAEQSDSCVCLTADPDAARTTPGAFGRPSRKA